MLSRLRALPALLMLATAAALSGCGGRNLDDRFFAPGGLIGLLIVIADVYAIIQIINSRESTGSKVLWGAFVFFAPVVGLVCWYLFGPKAAK
ncbi:MAG: PLDc N-terminal domain-containing protein [Rubricoccaceae bacterium]